jgi:hypothetical protein
MSLLMLMVLAPIGLLVALLCLKRPLSVALPAFAASIPFGSLLQVGHSRFGSLSSILGLLVLIGLVLRLTVSRRQLAPLSPTVFLWLGFLAVAATTTLWSLSATLTANGILEIGSLIGIYCLVSMSQVDRDIVRRVELGLIVGGLAAVGYGLVQLTLLGGFPNDVPGLPPGPGGRFGNDLLGPNNNAVAFLLPLCFCLQRSATASRASTRRLYAVFAFLMFLGIVMTGSRGGLLSAVLCTGGGSWPPTWSPASSPAWSRSSCTRSDWPSATCRPRRPRVAPASGRWGSRRVRSTAPWAPAGRRSRSSMRAPNPPCPGPRCWPARAAPTSRTT